MIVAEHSGIPGLSLRATPLPPSWHSMGEMLKGLRVPMVMNDLNDSHPMSAPHAAFLDRRFASMAIVPLVVDGETAGGLGLFSDKTGHFSEERDALLRSVADELSNALSRMRLEGDLLRLGTAIEQISDAVMFLSPEGVIRYINTGFERMLGHTRAELFGKSAAALIRDKPDPHSVREMRECIREWRDWHGRCDLSYWPNHVHCRLRECADGQRQLRHMRESLCGRTTLFLGHLRVRHKLLLQRLLQR